MIVRKSVEIRIVEEYKGDIHEERILFIRPEKIDILACEDKGILGTLLRKEYGAAPSQKRTEKVKP